MSGDISLTCTWRVTPLDMAALKVKTKQSELDRKEEVLALLEERTGGPSPQISPGGPVGSPGGDIGGTLSPVASPNTGLAEQKRLMASRGALSLKVGYIWGLAVLSLVAGLLHCLQDLQDVSCNTKQPAPHGSSPWREPHASDGLQHTRPTWTLASTSQRHQATQLAVCDQVIEARHLTVPADVLHAFFTMDAYIVAGLNSEAGITSRQTKV